MADEEMFKTKVIGEEDGKMIDAVEQSVKQAIHQESEDSGEMDDLRKQLKEKDAEIERLRQKLDEKDTEIESLRDDIRNKYQSYIDNYESIGSLVYDSKVRSDQMLRDAEAKKDKILADADAEAKRKIDAIQAEIDRRIDDGEQRYKAVEEELENIVDTVNQVQRRFMESYRAIHRIVQDVPGMGHSEEEDE
jgi:DNA repair exonuclease SbcCD ATPase subunit